MAEWLEPRNQVNQVACVERLLPVLPGKFRGSPTDEPLGGPSALNSSLWRLAFSVFALFCLVRVVTTRIISTHNMLRVSSHVLRVVLIIIQVV